MASFLVGLVLSLTILAVGVQAKGETAFDRLFKSQLKQCELNYCVNQRIYSNNCQKYCLSPRCYELTWSRPIEPGEENYQLERKFKDCYYERYLDCGERLECLTKQQPGS